MKKSYNTGTSTLVLTGAAMMPQFLNLPVLFYYFKPPYKTLQLQNT